MLRSSLQCLLLMDLQLLDAQAYACYAWRGWIYETAIPHMRTAFMEGIETCAYSVLGRRAKTFCHLSITIHSRLNSSSNFEAVRSGGGNGPGNLRLNQSSRRWTSRLRSQYSLLSTSIYVLVPLLFASPIAVLLHTTAGHLCGR